MKQDISVNEKTKRCHYKPLLWVAHLKTFDEIEEIRFKRQHNCKTKRLWFLCVFFLVRWGHFQRIQGIDFCKRQSHVQQYERMKMSQTITFLFINRDPLNSVWVFFFSPINVVVFFCVCFCMKGCYQIAPNRSNYSSIGCWISTNFEELTARMRTICKQTSRPDVGS